MSFTVSPPPENQRHRPSHGPHDIGTRDMVAVSIHPPHAILPPGAGNIAAIGRSSLAPSAIISRWRPAPAGRRRRRIRSPSSRPSRQDTARRAGMDHKRDGRIRHPGRRRGRLTASTTQYHAVSRRLGRPGGPAVDDHRRPASRNEITRWSRNPQVTNTGDQHLTDETRRSRRRGSQAT